MQSNIEGVAWQGLVALSQELGGVWGAISGVAILIAIVLVGQWIARRLKAAYDTHASETTDMEARKATRALSLSAMTSMRLESPTLSSHDPDDEDDSDDQRGRSHKSTDREERSRRAAQIIQKIEQARSSRVIAIIHRETLESESLGMNDLEDVLTALNAMPPTTPLDIILHTRGGASLAAMQISRTIKAHQGRKTAFVPYFAMSAGTMIALACDEIVMTPHACLGPIDPQYGVPAVSILKVARTKPIEAVGDDTLIFADLAEKALAEAREQACELMQGTYSHDGSCMITDQLTSGRWTHGNPITVSAAQGIGLHVKVGMPQDIINLVRVHRISRRGGPSVGFRG